MNREQRRLMEREERRNKSKDEGKSRSERAASRIASAPADKQPWFKRLLTFLHDVRQEMKKVSWPTQQQMVVFTTVTVITSVALTLIIFTLDVALKEAVLLFIGGA